MVGAQITAAEQSPRQKVVNIAVYPTGVATPGSRAWKDSWEDVAFFAPPAFWSAFGGKTVTITWMGP
jgi:hypothetical protein